ncbi:bifunctional folylpolyglutamate synthase/dihydrofolate synthase [Rhodohalobacter sp. 8-1]|uniref:bifunctional folylpolyglutamate synthase/dihydrofolate synthase n=1 Tax=Rhodohalobacter sp. 8-1 TaxID=3131972 RepID=UPI0030EDAC5B
MTRYKTIEAVYETLNTIPMFGDRGRSAANFSLDTIREFCGEIGNPQADFRSIHVAGTNGKGTTCRMLASVYQSAGYKTGLFTSPHLIDFRERITIDSEWITEQHLLTFFQKYERLIEKFSLTYFELATAIGFWYFSEKSIDVAIIETGLGGRLDATNIILPEAAAITSVGMDHTDILGNTIEEIAREKAGIIKPNTPVVVGDLPNAAMSEIENHADSLNAPVINSAAPDYSLDPVMEDNSEAKQLTLAARLNAQIVRCILDCVTEQIPVSSYAVADGLLKWSERYPAGASFRRIHPDYQWYFDGAHNPEAVKLMKRQLTELSPLSDWRLVFSIMRDKLTPGLISELLEIGTVYYHPLKLGRAATEKEVKELVPDIEILNADDSLPESWVQKNKSELVIFGGSFYFYKTLKQWMGNIADH